MVHQLDVCGSNHESVIINTEIGVKGVQLHGYTVPTPGPFFFFRVLSVDAMTEAPKNKARRRLEKLIGSQTTSFNWFLDEGKNLALADLDPAEWSYKPENQSGSGSGSESDSDSGSDMGQGSIRCIHSIFVH